MHDAQMHDNEAFNTWRVLQRSKELVQWLKKHKLNHRNPFSSKWNDFLEWVSHKKWDKSWKNENPEMHIDKEVKALTTCFNNLPLSNKSSLDFLAQHPRNSSFSFLLIFLKAWNLEQWSLRWSKAPQWWQKMCLGPLGFLERYLATWFYSLFNFGHWGLIWLVTPQ